MSPRRSPFLEGGLAWIHAGERPDRCPACAFEWSIAVDEALAIVAGAPGRYRELLEGRDGMVPADDGGWNATAYLWHLTDLARAWSERWVQIREAPGSLLVGFDPDELAAARAYTALPTSPGLWALEHAVDTFVVLTRALDPEATFEHGDWGTGTVADGLRWIAHELHHHQLDVGERVG